jgi:AcrR family transcriptional regulator
MARPTTYDDDLRARLLEATAEQVDRTGPARASLREIARAAGTSTSAVYTLFGGKDELLGALVQSAFTSFATAQGQAAPQGLRALGEAYRAWALEHPALYRLMFSGVLADYERPSDASDDALAPLVQALAARGAADPLAAAYAVWAHVHGAVGLEFAGVAPPEVDYDAVYATVLDSVESLWPAVTPPES